MYYRRVGDMIIFDDGINGFKLIHIEELLELKIKPISEQHRMVIDMISGLRRDLNLKKILE
jgi:hypothetical protein